MRSFDLPVPLIPVVVCDDEEQAILAARSLMDGGISVMEVTLRTERALHAIEATIRECPDMQVGAGTVTRRRQWDDAVLNGASFIVSPGVTSSLLDAAEQTNIPYLPGAATCSEIMLGLERGVEQFKLFPAIPLGGLTYLRALAGPFPKVRFCPTGGLDAVNFVDFLAEPSVFAVGGSWMVPRDALRRHDGERIASLTRQTLARISDRPQAPEQPRHF